jgi:hypothetical protein
MRIDCRGSVTLDQFIYGGLFGADALKFVDVLFGEKNA